MTKPIIYLITEGNLTEENFADNKQRIFKLVEIAVENKISFIQVREKQVSSKLVFELASQAVKITKNSQTKLLVNDRADIALAANADGVHLTENSIPAEIIRKNFPEKFIIGVSTHSLKAAEKAKKQGADFVTFSPVFSSPGKGEPQGLGNLTEICKKLKPFPVLALGGIDETNYRSVLQSGANGFAAIRFLNKAENLQKLKREFFD
ncbi:MAG: thiamine phosphate synthase [Pyrinomonadaceae bacterium]